MIEKDKYEIGEIVRLRVGCVWLYGVIDTVCDNDVYECYYGTTADYLRIMNGCCSGFNYFAHFDGIDIRSTGKKAPWLVNKKT